MERRADGIAAVWISLRRVATRFSNVDFSALRPWPVHGLIWHHPNSRPEPVTFRHFGDYFDAAILQRLLALCGETGTADRIDDCTCCLVAADGTHCVVVGRASSLFGQIQYVAVVDLIRCDWRGLGSESRNDVQALRIRICILRIVRSPIKGPSTESSSLQLVTPDTVVDFAEVVRECKTECSCAHIDVSVSISSCTCVLRFDTDSYSKAHIPAPINIPKDIKDQNMIFSHLFLLKLGSSFPVSHGFSSNSPAFKRALLNFRRRGANDAALQLDLDDKTIVVRRTYLD